MIIWYRSHLLKEPGNSIDSVDDFPFFQRWEKVSSLPWMGAKAPPLKTHRAGNLKIPPPKGKSEKYLSKKTTQIWVVQNFSFSGKMPPRYQCHTIVISFFVIFGRFKKGCGSWRYLSFTKEKPSSLASKMWQMVASLKLDGWNGGVSPCFSCNDLVHHPTETKHQTTLVV